MPFRPDKSVALLADTLRLAERCCFSLDELRNKYPEQLAPEGHTPDCASLRKPVPSSRSLATTVAPGGRCSALIRDFQ